MKQELWNELIGLDIKNKNIKTQVFDIFEKAGNRNPDQIMMHTNYYKQLRKELRYLIEVECYVRLLKQGCMAYLNDIQIVIQLEHDGVYLLNKSYPEYKHIH